MTQEQFEAKLHELGLIRHKPDGNYIFHDSSDDSVFSDGCLSINLEYCYDDIFMFYPEDLSEHEYDDIIAAFKQHTGWKAII